MSRIKTFAAAPAMLAALSLSYAPALAAEMPVPLFPSQVDVASPGVSDNTAQYHRRYRRDRVDVGDILTGVLIIGGIAAIANSAKRSEERRRDARYRDADWRDGNYPDRDTRYRTDDTRGIDNAVARCVREIERDVRVEGVDSVERDASGWRVAGVLYNGDGFTCRIGSDGQIEDVDYSGRSGSYGVAGEQVGGGQASGEDRQYSDDRYLSAWANMASGPDNYVEDDVTADQGGAAYPGGPIDGDLD